MDRFVRASADFARVLREVEPAQWVRPTPCAEWNVRQLVNHMARGNIGYAMLAAGGSGTEFLELRDADALGDDPVGAYLDSVTACIRAFAEPDALHRILDYPLGKVTGRQALAVRTTDSVVHTWDLARAIGADDAMDAGLVDWILENLEHIYANLPETPIDPETTHRFFAAATGTAGPSLREQLLFRMGRSPDWRPPEEIMTGP
ncbi:TIGR03086 family protein [Nocardia terpenica]|uniref:TIGR03086 family metal-binding protein n=1 Tax=Nocardia terpenica TaxID=455432 RepID=UPI002FE1651C